MGGLEWAFIIVYGLAVFGIVAYIANKLVQSERLELRTEINLLNQKLEQITDDYRSEARTRDLLLATIERKVEALINCTKEMESLKVQLKNLQFDIKANIVDTNTAIKILGIWPDIGELGDLDITKEIRLVSETSFSYSKLYGEQANRQSIVNELSLDPTINIIQIGAHGDPGIIFLSSNNGVAYDKVPTDWFTRVLSKYNIKLVILFACTSSEIVDSLYRGKVPAVLGFRAEVSDDDIINFIKPFYKFISSNSVAEAVRLTLLSYDNKLGDSIVLRGDYTF